MSGRVKMPVVAEHFGAAGVSLGTTAVDAASSRKEPQMMHQDTARLQHLTQKGDLLHTVNRVLALLCLTRYSFQAKAKAQPREGGERAATTTTSIDETRSAEDFVTHIVRRLSLVLSTDRQARPPPQPPKDAVPSAPWQTCGVVASGEEVRKPDNKPWLSDRRLQVVKEVERGAG